MIEDETINIEEDYNKKELCEEVRDLIEELSPRDQVIISLYYGINNRQYTQKEIAEIYSLTQSYIARIIQRNLKKLENKFLIKYKQDEVLKRYLLKRTR